MSIRDDDAPVSDIRDVVSELIAALGPTLVAALSGTSNREQLVRWSQPDAAEPEPGVSKRLRFTHQEWRRLSVNQGGDIARAWFIGSNPRLNSDTPLTAIREGRLADVSAAVDAAVEV